MQRTFVKCNMRDKEKTNGQIRRENLVRECKENMMEQKRVEKEKQLVLETNFFKAQHLGQYREVDEEDELNMGSYDFHD